MKCLLHAAALLVAAAAASCGSNATGSTMSGSPTTPTAVAVTTPPAPATPVVSLPAMYQDFGNGTQVSLDGQVVILRTRDLPDHNSPYYGAGHPQYESPHPGMQVNPNLIVTQNLVFRVPASPAAAAQSDTPLGPIGVAVNGVALFNQYAAGRSPLTSEIPSFDRYSGHPQQAGQYHYHVEPVWIAAARGKSALIGVLLDGFPVYGTVEADGSAPSGLDACNGHVGPTPHVGQGIYHYHVTASPPYISGCFRGAPGSIG